MYKFNNNNNKDFWATALNKFGPSNYKYGPIKSETRLKISLDLAARVKQLITM